MQDAAPTGKTFGDDSISSIVNLYDSEFLAAEKVWKTLQDRAQGRSVDRDNLHREIHERFREIGLVVRVNWYQGGELLPDGTLRALEGVYVPEISIQARTETKGQFDHDKMAWEVQNNILELPGQEKGKISMSAGDMAQWAKRNGHDGHKH